ncbi:hypothetical protein ABPG77_009078 [Micractinium sp. CCAP 211/92]
MGIYENEQLLIGVEVSESSFFDALSWFELEGALRRPPSLSLLDTAARAVALRLEVEPDWLSVAASRLPPDLMPLVTRHIFKFAHYGPFKAAHEELERLWAAKWQLLTFDAAVIAALSLPHDRELLHRWRGGPPSSHFGVHEAHCDVLHGVDNCNCEMGVAKATKRMLEALLAELGLPRGKMARRHHIRFSNCVKRGHVYLAIKEPQRLPSEWTSYFGQNHLGQGRSVIRAPTVEERLLIVDAVRWLGLEPVGADEAQLLELFVRTSDGDWTPG